MIFLIRFSSCGANPSFRASDTGSNQNLQVAALRCT